MRHATILAASLAAALLLTAVSATLPHRRRANLRRSAFESAAQPKTASVSAAQPKPVTRKVNSIAAATEAAAAHAGILQGRRKAKVQSLRSVIGSVKGRPGTLGARLRQTRKNRSAANLRKAIQKAAPGVAQTAEALRRKGINSISTIIDVFVAYDTPARRSRLQLPALNGTAAQIDKCKRLGWALVGLYQDLSTGEDIKYNEGCSEDDLWLTGIGEDDGLDTCEKMRRTADQDINWDLDESQLWYRAPCWGSKEFKDYCSETATAKCTLNGTKGTGTTGTVTKSWYTGTGTSTGGPGEFFFFTSVKGTLMSEEKEHSLECPQGGPGFFKKADQLMWEYQGQIHDSCQIVLFYDYGLQPSAYSSSAVTVTNDCTSTSTISGELFFYDDNSVTKAKLYPLMCSDGSTEKTSESLTVFDPVKRLIESSYTRESGGNNVPMEYVFMTYTDHDADFHQEPWLVSPAPIPMYGTDLLVELSESVGMACVNDGVAEADYCLQDFYYSLWNMFRLLWPLMDSETEVFGPAQKAAMELVLETSICSKCTGILFDYMYMNWADADEDDKYLRVYMEMACSKAPPVGGGADKWCLPVQMDMQDDTYPELDSTKPGYKQADVDAYVDKQGDLWCVDLCVKSIKAQEKEMEMIDLYSNTSWACDMKACSPATIEARKDEIATEEMYEAQTCHVMERPPQTNASTNETFYDWNYCGEMTWLPVHVKVWDDMSAACMPTADLAADFDPYYDFPATATCKDGCKAKLAAFVSNVNPGWGCCTKSLLDGLEADPETKDFSVWMTSLGRVCGVPIPANCQTPDGGEIAGEVTIDNVEAGWFSGLSATVKTQVMNSIAADLSKSVGVDRTQVSVTISASNTQLSVKFTIRASGARQAEVIQKELGASDVKRRQNVEPLGFKSLTSNPAARSNPKLPVTGKTSNVGVKRSLVDFKTALHFVVIEVTMPYTKAEFDADKQTKFKKALAKVALTTPERIDLEISDARRRAGSVKVATKIYATNDKGLNEIKATMGTDTTKLLAKINVELAKEGLKASTGVTAPKTGTPKPAAGLSDAGLHGPSATFGSMVAALVVMLSSFA